MSRARAFPAAAPVLVALSLVAASCGDGGAAPECTSAATCPAPASPCVVPMCVDGRCTTAPVAEGALVDGTTDGDCLRRVCDGAGGVTTVPDDMDLPVDANACTADRCAGGVASNPAEPEGTACAQDGGAACDGAGACVQCLAAADCGSDGECATPTCEGGICGVTFAPPGTPLASQVAGDCRQAVCDGFGLPTTAPLDTDLPPDDGLPCSDARCHDGAVVPVTLAAGTACSTPEGGVVCDGLGVCVECLSADACPGDDGECRHRACRDGACGIAYAPAGTAVTTQVSGDCVQDVCDGAGAVMRVDAPDDVPVDGLDCTEDSCSGGAPSNPPAAAGTACHDGAGAVCDGSGACVECVTGSDCASQVCADHACQAPTCTDGVKNGVETDVDCGGAECPDCAPPARCLVDADCTTGVCHDTLLTCQNPSCTDGLRNGDETDVDCGGSCSANCARGRACLVDDDCATANCQDLTCAGPRVTAVLPWEGAADVPPGTGITLTFGLAPYASSVTAQPSAGPCSGSVQISADDFATCVGVSGKLAGYAAGSPVSPAVTLQPVGLARGTTYRVRTTSALSHPSLGAFEPFETPVGFTTAAPACGGSVVISQIYPGGGLAGAAYWRDYVELHNNGTVPVRLDGWSVQYAYATGTTWARTALAGTIAPGGYHLVQLGGGSSGGAALPTPDAIGTTDLSTAGGKIALVSSTVVPADYATSCLTVGVLDLVGYGASSGTPTACKEGPAPAPAPADPGAALVRLGAGCADGNGNALDLVSQLALPRSSASAPAPCGCNGLPVNETGLTVEMDSCNVQHPLGLAAVSGATAGPIYGRVFESGITDPWGAPAAVTGQLGVGPFGTDPRWAAGWTFVPATWNAQFLDDDEFQASFTAPAPGSYAYVYRFSPDGERWTYCDPDGAGSADGATFQPNALPALTVTAP